MAGDDIVQRIVIQGAEEAASIFNSIGDAATRAWEVVKQAFAGMGDAVSNAGSVVSTFVQSFREGFSGGLTAEMQKGQQALAGTSQALKNTSDAAKNTAEAFNVTRGEMRLFHEIAGELGVGPLASLGTILGKTTLELGLLAAGVVSVGLALGVLVKFADEATKNVAALGRLADISGQSFEGLSAEQVAFQKLGVSAEQFNKEFTNLELEINKAAPQIADELARSADKTAAAFEKIQIAALNTRQVFQQGLQLNLQTQQLGLQAQQLQLQLQYQQQNFAIQQKRADLSVKDAEANVRILSLKQQLRSGDIDEQEFAERMAQEEERAAIRAREKAKLDADAAKLAKEQLGEQQRIQAEQLQLHIKQNALQQETNALAKERNKLDQDRSAREEKTAGLDALKTQANDLEKIVGLMKQLAEGQKDIKFDALTTLDTKVKAVDAALIDAKKNGENVRTVLANILQAIPAESDAYNIGKKLGLDDKTIAEMRAKGGAFIQNMADEVKAANQALTASDRERFAKYEEELNRLTTNWNQFKTQAGTAFVTVATYLDDSEKNMQHVSENIKKLLVDVWPTIGDAAKQAAINIASSFGSGFIDPILEAFGKIFGKIVEVAQQAGKGIYDGFVNAFNGMLSPIQSAINTIAGWIQGLVDKAVQLWNAITGAKGSAQGGSVGGGDTGGIPMAEGGLFNGQRSGIDTNLVWLTSGEFIMNTNAVRAYGVGMMNAINSLRAPRFAVGGLNVPIPRLAGVTPTPSLSGQRTLNLTIEGRSFSGLSLPENTAQSLERFAVHSQIASTGRKQSWRR